MIEIAAGFGSALAIALLVPRYIERKHTKTNREWYNEHIKDNIDIAPPSIVFPIVWSILYIFMATAIGIWSLKPDDEMSGGNYIATWVLINFNLLFNLLWTLVFFSFRDKSWSILVALVDALLIFGTAVAIVVLFHLSSESNAWVFVLWYPYVIWTGFALLLTFAIWLCNREDGLGIEYAPIEA